MRNKIVQVLHDSHLIKYSSADGMRHYMMKVTMRGCVLYEWINNAYSIADDFSPLDFEFPKGDTFTEAFARGFLKRKTQDFYRELQQVG